MFDMVNELDYGPGGYQQPGLGCEESVEELFVRTQAKGINIDFDGMS